MIRSVLIKHSKATKSKISKINLACKQALRAVHLWDQSSTYHCLFFINVFLMHISSHSKVSYFTSFLFSNQHITSCKVTMNNLAKYLTSVFIKTDSIQAIPKVSYFTSFLFSNQHITSCKVTMNDLAKYLTSVFIKTDSIQARSISNNLYSFSCHCIHLYICIQMSFSGVVASISFCLTKRYDGEVPKSTILDFMILL